MRTLEFEWQGQTLHLCLNGAALFDIYDKFGTKGSITDHINGTGKKSFSATCWMLAKLAEQGELVRRYQGHDRGEIPTEQMLQVMLRPSDVAAAKVAIRYAVVLGFKRDEDPEDQEIDVGLLELQKKTAVT